MNFDFSDELKQLRDQSRKFLVEHCPPAARTACWKVTRATTGTCG
jgi:hypothetical protein